MYKLDQTKTPIFSNLKDVYAAKGVLPFHVPGHKQGKGIESEFLDFIGPNIFKIDVTLLEMVDGLHHPKSHIKEALELAADLYGAKESFFTINGTSGAVQTLILSAVNAGDKILVPRNTHTSVNAGIILSGAKPVYMQPEIDHVNGITHGVSPETVKQTLLEHPDAAAVMIINPTYYGVATDLKEIVSIVHEYDIPVLVDEAHGPHLQFSDELPISAMEAGADGCAQSTHKLIGALTQSSMLHIQGGRLSSGRVRQVLNLLQTTSPSYVLLASLDVARKQIAIDGKKLISDAISNAKWFRKEINKIKGMRCFGDEIPNRNGRCLFDPTKVTISAKEIGLTGYQLEKALLENYNIQAELSDLYNILLVTTYADSKKDFMRVLKALQEISSFATTVDSQMTNVSDFKFSHIIPKMSQTPRDSFFSKKIKRHFQDSIGHISGESIMVYPPGIPILCAGEEITEEIIHHVQNLKRANLPIQGLEDHNFEFINTIDL